MPEPLEGIPLAWPAADDDLPRRFAHRPALAQALHHWFPNASGELAPWRGGRQEAERRLAAVDPARYGASRNHLQGAVTRLSPYIRHGVLTLAETRDAVFARLPWGAEAPPPGRGRAKGRPGPAGIDGAAYRAGERLITELGWRDYWQRLWQQLGPAIWHDRESLHTGLSPADYSPQLPPDLAAGRTGLACIDGFVAELMQGGWLHNHARLWLASYVVHWRQVRWQSGASWFLRHLLDGDPASNNLSWQWVASSFSSKPYIFNRANLERYSGGEACRQCPLNRRGCPFDASYEALEARLFPAPGAHQPPLAKAPAAAAPPAAPHAPALTNGSPVLQRPVLWVHGEALGPANPALQAHPGQPALFVFDAELIAGATATSSDPQQAAAAGLSLQRLGFLYDCLLELPVTIRRGNVVAEVLAFARRHGADGVVTSRAVDPRFQQQLAQLAAALPVQVLEPEPFVPPATAGSGGRSAQPDLARFSRYWRWAEGSVWHWGQAQADLRGPRAAADPPAASRPG